MTINKTLFGRIDNQDVYLLEMKNRKGLKASVITFGAAVTSLLVPDKYGNTANVVLGYDSLEKYDEDIFYMGSLVGRFAGRIGNARFSINGEEYKLQKNDGKTNNHIHGGGAGFNKKNFAVTDIRCGDHTAIVQLYYRSVDMEEGYPGSLDVWVSYELNNNEFIIRYKAVSDKATHVNLTNHSYFNLSGKRQSVLQHKVQINADRYLPTNKDYIPTGEIISVTDTPYDFRSLRSIEQYKSLLPFSGYNEYYVLNHDEDKTTAAVLYDPVSGRKMQVSTSLPGLLFYTGDYLNGRFKKCQGVCFETQFFPDTPSRPEFPSTLLLPSQEYEHETCLKFS